MAKRLNPKRRREMRQHVLHLEALKAANPTTQGEIGTVRQATVKTLFGSSHKPAGWMHSELGVKQYAQHKRRKPTKAGEQVSVSTVDHVTFPDQIPDKAVREAIPAPLPTKRINRPNKVVPKGSKSFGSLKGSITFPVPEPSTQRTFPGVKGTRVDNGED